jgi:hypothetical protein
MFLFIDSNLKINFIIQLFELLTHHFYKLKLLRDV